MATFRKDTGKWRAQVLLGTDASGKRVYKSFEANTADEADLLALTYKLGKGKNVNAADITLRTAMLAYIESKRAVLSPSTIQGYEIIEHNFGPFLDTKLARITKLALQTAISQYMYRPRHDGKKGSLSAKTVRNAYGLINATLQQNGIDLGEISLPRKQELEYATPFDSDLARIFECVKGTSIELPVLLAACYSLRREEICGLRYDDVDFQSGRIRILRAKLYIKGEEIIKSPKTPKSKRTIFVGEYVLELIRKKREEEGGEYIVTIRPDTIGKRFGVVLQENGLPRCRFHDLRHSFASILQDHGIDPAYIRAVGGWSSDHVMNKVYTQVSESSIQRKSTVANSIFDAIMQPVATEKDKNNQ